MRGDSYDFKREKIIVTGGAVGSGVQFV